MASSNHDERIAGEQTPKPGGAVEVAAATTPEARNTTLEEYERLFAVDEDAYEQPTTTRKELWSYYLYYNGKDTTYVFHYPLITMPTFNNRFLLLRG